MFWNLSGGGQDNAGNLGATRIDFDSLVGRSLSTIGMSLWGHWSGTTALTADTEYLPSDRDRLGRVPAVLAKGQKTAFVGEQKIKQNGEKAGFSGCLAQIFRPDAGQSKEPAEVFEIAC